MRFLNAGIDGILVELADLAQALALLDQLKSAEIDGILEMVPAARTVMLRFDPAVVSRLALVERISRLDLTPGEARAGQLFEIPVTYDGEDLPDVAMLLGLSVEALIQRHTEALYTVAFTGFAPGFAYMTADDPAFVVPRRAAPRLRIPAGSVALAGTFGGIYPSDSPGGWQLIGRTPVPMWDLSRPRAALLAPGDRVRFRDMAKGATVALGSLGAPTPVAPAITTTAEPDLTVLDCLSPILLQDEGRPFQASQGVSQSGALDRRSFAAVNRLLGNPRGTAALELSYGSVRLRANRAVTLALTGAEAPMRLRPRGGDAALAVPHGRPFAMDAGDLLLIGAPQTGAVSYLGLRGGIAAEPALGSLSRDTLARIGPEPLIAGSHIHCGHAHAGSVALEPDLGPALPKTGDVVRIDVALGPREDWFTTEALHKLFSQEWRVSTEISRTGLRLQAPVPLEWRTKAELPSEATRAGAIQVPHSGLPVLFLSDHPLTGGYPVVACVAPHHLDLAAQTPAGAFFRFTPMTKGN